ncbi:MAG: LysE family transporter [Bacteroidota bacterium]
MIESFITVVIIGFAAGFIFSMPIAGPISIIITSNALKGNPQFCNRTALGASIIEFFYVLVAVFGLSMLFSLYSSMVPYVLIIGSIFLLAIGIKIIRSRIKLEDFEKHETNNETTDKSGGLRTGLIVNLTNPSLFFGILTSSFLVLSFASSIGLNTGGLDILVHENVTSLQEIAGDELTKIDSTYINNNNGNGEAEHSSYTLLLSAIYALSLSFGGFTWLVLLAKLLIKYRNKIKIEILNWIIRFLGLILCGIGVYLLWKSYTILMN